jgi:DNA-nicking Smr family endonuclease
VSARERPQVLAMKTPHPPVRTLADLKQVKRLLSEQAAARERLATEQAAARLRKTSAAELFQRAAGAVTALPDRRRAQIENARPTPVPRQRLLDQQAVLVEAISDEFDVSTLLDIDDQLSFRRPGIGTDVTRKLRMGHWSIQRQLDLHGLRSDEAREQLSAFVRNAHLHGIRCVRVVHGKGLGSPGKAPVLKNKVFAWLVQKNEVLAFVQARPAEGGAGALVVLLQPGGPK